jgi:type I restriction enzyme S subunit
MLPANTNQALAIIRLRHDSKLDLHYLFHYVVGPQIRNHIERINVQSAQANVSLANVNEFVIEAPSSQQQRKIARILTTVDNLIEKTEALIAKYQAIKQGMMHDLFTRGVDEHGHLRPPYEEAPELYKQSELGWIPKEWEVCRVGDRLERIEQGWSPDCESEPASTGEWGVLKTTAVVWEGFACYENKRLPKHLPPLPQYEVHVDDVLMTRGGPNSRVGVVAHVRETTDKLMLSDKIYRLVPKKGLLPNYFALALSSERTQTHLSTLKTGLAESQTNISQEIVRRLWIGLPKPDEQRRTCERLEAVHQVMKAELNGLAKLRLRKSGLMQDLLTGRVRVSEIVPNC